MVVFSIFAKARSFAIAAAVATGILGANPAFANNNSNADIAAPLRAAEAARPSALGTGDDEFRALFASWQSLDRPAPAPGVPAAPIARTSVSIPSLMPLANAALTSGYGSRIHPVLGVRRNHRGIDLAAPIGTPIYATADGVVSRADLFSTYGLFVSIEHGGEIQTRYGHMSRLNVAAGQTVRKGELIGYVGSTGRSTGPHLHYEVRIAGQSVNPVPYLQGTIAPAVVGGQGGE